MARVKEEREGELGSRGGLKGSKDERRRRTE